MLDNPQPLTLDQAKTLKAGDIIHPLDGNGRPMLNRSNPEPMRFKVTSVKTWKRKPDQIKIKAQRGLYERVVLMQYHLDGWFIPTKEATPNT